MSESKLIPYWPFSPAPITPGKRFGLPVLWTTVNAIQKSMTVKSDKALGYSSTIPEFKRF